MIARKPLPENTAAVDNTASLPAPPNTGMQATKYSSPPEHSPPGPPSATVTDTAAAATTTAAAEPESEEQPDAADSDVDSWERASASSSEDDDDDDDDDNDDADAPRPPAYEEVKGKQYEATTRGDAALHAGSSGEASSTFPPLLDGGGWEDEALRNTPDSKPPAAPVAGLTETNPFRRKMSLSALNGATVPPRSTETPPPPPLPAFPTEDLAKLSLNDVSTTNPWQPILDDQQKTVEATAVPSVSDQESCHNIWDSQEPSRVASAGPTPSDSKEPLLTPYETAGWSDKSPEIPSAIAVPASFRKPVEGEELEEHMHAWDDVAKDAKGKSPMMPTAHINNSAEDTREEEWNLIDNEPTPGPSGSGPSQAASLLDEKAPILPPRSDEKAPLPPPRAPVSGKTETYQVKNINWHDPSCGKKPRKSPILVQNANGPCPLMALVNALTITTPVSADDAVLVNTLRTREQISLDLLLDAVFDELMSERRTAPDEALPDVTELYSFLKGLHTGMNVNPRFIPTEETEKAFKRTSLTHLHPTERGDLIPGTFEDTQEMAFYRIFRVPLIHGWLPSKEEPVYGGLTRHAESYEDAQNILFREEELEDKLSNSNGDGLTQEEQALYQDILSIKAFLYTAATQLTPWGLEVITKAMRPGSVAILFRNDHFSTLYRHPQTLQIFTLVTDAGYAGHQEVVWESLVDVNGENSEFFAGDFRVVGGSSQGDQYAASGSASASNAQGEWTTVESNRGKEKSPIDGSQLSPKEQEDRDLALALQLQEEEDQRHRAEQAQRRRETQLSEQFIEQQGVRRGPTGIRQTGSNNNDDSNGGGNGSPQAPPTTASVPVAAPAPAAAPVAAVRRGTSASTPARGGSTNNAGRGGRPTQQVRPLVPPVLRSRGVNRSAEAEDVDDAPPSYEDAARDRPYVPPAGHPSHPGSSPNPSMNSPRLPGPRMAGLAGVPQQPPAFRRNNVYRQGVPPATASAGPRDRDCVVM